MESLAPVLVDELQLVLTSCRPAPTSWSATRSGSGPAPADLVRTSEEFLAASWAAAAGGGKAPVDLGAASLRDLDDVEAARARPGLPWWTLAPFTLDAEAADGHRSPSRSTPAPAYRGDTEALADLRAVDARRLAGRAGLRRATAPPQRAVERLAGAEIPARLVAGIAALEPGVVDGDHRAAWSRRPGLPGAAAGRPDRGRPHRPARHRRPRTSRDAGRAGATRSTRSS